MNRFFAHIAVSFRPCRVMVCLLLAGVAWAGEGAAESAPQPAAETSAETAPVKAEGEDQVALKVTVVTAEGLVQFRASEDKPWQPLAKGQELVRGAEVRTGPGSRAQLRVGEDQVVTLDRLGTLKVLRTAFDKQAQKVRTDLGMKYGRTSYEVEAGGVEHESKIHAPGATLAMRGSAGSVESTPLFPIKVNVVYSREAEVTRRGTRPVRLQSGRLTGKTSTPGEQARGDTYYREGAGQPENKGLSVIYPTTEGDQFEILGLGGNVLDGNDTASQTESFILDRAPKKETKTRNEIIGNRLTKGF
ncbi:MAG: hypothetical protein R3336_09905, partial [Phycisphaeraceae bacterium]|nr:hypothetical protein [Phycisphaeraceae bacterium]